MRAGDFSFGGGQNLDQGSNLNIPRGFPGAGTPVPGRNLSPYIDPIGRALINLYPQPNYNDPNNRYNYIFDPLVDANRNQGIVRVDYNVTDNTRAFVRLARDSEVSEMARGLWWQPGAVELPSPMDQGSVGQSAVLNVTSVLSPTTTNEILFTWSRLQERQPLPDPEAMSLDAIGASGLENPFGGSGIIPDIVNEFSGAGRGSMWFAQDVENIFSYNGFLRVGDNFTKVLNSHAIKIGGIGERQYKQQNFQHNSNIQLNFATWTNGGTGNEFGDLLVGRPAQMAQGTPSAVGHFRYYNYEGYAQDSWKVKPNFTLEYGVRVNYLPNNYERDSLGAVFDPRTYVRGAGAYHRRRSGAAQRCRFWPHAARSPRASWTIRREVRATRWGSRGTSSGRRGRWFAAALACSTTAFRATTSTASSDSHPTHTASSRMRTRTPDSRLQTSGISIRSARSAASAPRHKTRTGIRFRES